MFSRGSGMRRKSETENVEISDPEKRDNHHDAEYEKSHSMGNPDKNRVSSKFEEDIEVGLEIPEAQLRDWSLLKDNSVGKAGHQRSSEQRHAKRASSNPVLPDILRPSQPETTYTSPHQSDQTRLNPSLETAAMAHRVRLSQENIRTGLQQPSPNTMTTQYREGSRSPQPRGGRKTPTPPPLPPAGRVPRSMSPLVQPLNSSQPWATSSHVPKRTRSNDLPIQRPQPVESSTRPNIQMQAAVRNGGLRVIGPGALHQNQTTSFPSMNAEDGSSAGVSLQHQRGSADSEDGSDEEWSLPLQRHSGPGMARGQAQPAKYT